MFKDNPNDQTHYDPEAERLARKTVQYSIVEDPNNYNPSDTSAQSDVDDRYFSFEFEVWQDDMMVASASGPRDDALSEAMNYASQYAQDGPVRVFEVTRTLVKEIV